VLIAKQNLVKTEAVVKISPIRNTHDIARTIRENMTSSRPITPTEEDRATATDNMHKMVKFGRVVSEICEQTDILGTGERCDQAVDRLKDRLSRTAFVVRRAKGNERTRHAYACGTGATLINIIQVESLAMQVN